MASWILCFSCGRGILDSLPDETEDVRDVGEVGVGVGAGAGAGEASFGGLDDLEDGFILAK
jgi:hypothetical protein